jgi:N-dimethylarginine dimethylaminohydrolase
VDGEGSEVTPLRRLVVKHPDDAVKDATAVADEARALNYAGTPVLDRAREEYDAFLALIASPGVDVLHLPRGGEVGLDSIYTRDASVVSPHGMILASMGKAERSGEPAAQARAFSAWGIPVAGAIQPPGRLEGGDVLWLDDRIVAVGRGYRTNAAGIAQFRAILGEEIDELIEVSLPHWRGPADVFHLMSIISPVDRRLAVVYSPLMPVPFRERLLDLGFDFIEVPDEEFDSMGANVLALGPRDCVMLAGNPRTRERLEQAGVRVRTYEGREISSKGGGGPTCLTRPVARDENRKPQETIPLSNTASVPLLNSTHSA